MQHHMIMIRHDRIRRHINGKYSGRPDDHFFKPAAAMFVTFFRNKIDTKKIDLPYGSSTKQL
jgi:hypothetical protein